MTPPLLLSQIASNTTDTILIIVLINSSCLDQFDKYMSQIICAILTLCNKHLLCLSIYLWNVYKYIRFSFPPVITLG